MGPVKSFLNEGGLEIDQFPVLPEQLAGLITLIDEGKVSFAVASQKLFPELVVDPSVSPLDIAERLNLIQDSNADSISPLIDQVIREFPLKVEEYRKGKNGIITMFMGEVMKRSKGKADPKMATELLTKKLNEK